MVVVVVVVVVTVVAVVRRHKRPSALWASGTHERGQLGKKKKRKKSKKKKRRNRPNDRSTRPFALEATLDTPIGSSAIPVRVNDDGTHSARFYWSSPSSPSPPHPPHPHPSSSYRVLWVATRSHPWRLQQERTGLDFLVSKPKILFQFKKKKLFESTFTYVTTTPSWNGKKWNDSVLRRCHGNVSVALFSSHFLIGRWLQSDIQVYNSSVRFWVERLEMELVERFSFASFRRCHGNVSVASFDFSSFLIGRSLQRHCYVSKRYLISVYRYLPSVSTIS